MRRLLALIFPVLFVVAIFYSLLAPLLPGLQRELGLSTTQVGVLVAVYGVGMIVGALPAALLTLRLGVRPATSGGLVVLALASLAFGVLAHSYSALVLARGVQGVGDALCGTPALAWLFDEAPLARRGELLGVATAGSGLGAIVGPLFGAIAVGVGRGPTFIGIAAASMALALAAAWVPSPARESHASLQIRAAIRSRGLRTAMWLNGVPALLLGAIGVLAPLQLHDLGASAGEVGAVFAIAGAIGVLVLPLSGRWSDRQGRLRPTRIALLVSCPVVLAVPWLDGKAGAALAIGLALIVTASLWVPMMAMLSDACSASGVSQVMGVTIMGLAFAPGTIIGSVGGAAITQAAGQRWAYAALAAMLAAVLLALSGSRVGVAEPPASAAVALAAGEHRQPQP